MADSVLNRSARRNVFSAFADAAAKVRNGRYFVKRGFQDGFEGLVIAHMAAIYVFTKYVKATSMGSR